MKASRSDVLSPRPQGTIYPESDGKPVGETDFHIAVIFYLRAALRYHFRRVDRLYAAANMLFYYEEGDPHAVTSPDVFVVKGIPNQARRTYKLWEEKAVPCTIFEITSKSSRLEDIGTKKGLFEMLGVREYFLFDPLDEYLRPRFQGFELDEGYYRPLDPAPDGTLRSRELDLILRPEADFLRIVDPETGIAVPSLEEAAERAQAEADRAQAEADRARTAEAENARLRAEIERLRRGR